MREGKRFSADYLLIVFRSYERKKKQEKRNQKRKEVKPVIPRTFGHGPLVASRLHVGPKTPDRIGVGLSRLASAPPSAKSCLRP